MYGGYCEVLFGRKIGCGGWEGGSSEYVKISRVFSCVTHFESLPHLARVRIQSLSKEFFTGFEDG